MDRDINQVTAAIVDAAMKLHTRLGPGLFESVYEALLAKELESRGLRVCRQKPIALEFDNVHFDEGFRIDLLVENVVVVELKSVDKLAPIHSKQLLTYLRLMDLRVGLLINFGAYALRDGLQRVVNNYDETKTAATTENAKH
jgi:iron complex transport system substrate-binding protein